MLLFESNHMQLYQSSVKAFPGTKARQNLVETILVKNIKYVPFVGMKTLYITAEAHNLINNNNYKPMILVKNVVYNQNSHIVIKDEANKNYFIENLKQNDIKIRCNCPDLRYRFCYYDWLDYSLYSKVCPKYEANGRGKPANPKEMPGMCKHLMALFNQIDAIH